MIEASKETKVSICLIRNVCNKHNKTGGGFLWCYCNEYDSGEWLSYIETITIRGKKI